MASLARAKSTVATPVPEDDPNAVAVLPGLDLGQPPFNKLTPGSHDGYIMMEEGGPEQFVKWHEQYGKMYKANMVNFGGESVFHAQPENVKKAFLGTNRPTIPLFNLMFEIASGVDGAKGSVSANGDKWKELRAPWDDMMMRGKASLRYHPIINNEAKLAMRLLNEEMNNNGDNNVNMMTHIQEYVSRVIGSIAFGTEFTHVTTGELSALDAARDLFPSALDVAFDPIPLPPSAARDRFYKNCEAIGGFARAAIADRKAKIAEIGPEKMLETQPDFLSALIAKPNRVTGESLSDSDLTSICFETLIGGTDTTTNTLNLGLTVVGRRPDIMDKIREEVVSVCGTNPDDDITTEMLMNTPYLSGVVNEMLRLHPATPMAGNRLQEKDMKIGDHEMKAGTIHINHVSAYNQDDSYFPDAATFNPDRWSTEGGTPKGSMAMGTFGYGARACPGQKVARAEAKIILAQLFKQFKPVYTKTEDPETYFFITVHPIGPLEYKLERW